MERGASVSAIEPMSRPPLAIIGTLKPTSQVNTGVSTDTFAFRDLKETSTRV